MEWRLHWLEAGGSLEPWRERIAHEIDQTSQWIAHVLPPPRLDILIQNLAGAVIPEVGMVGHAYRKNLFALTVDPANPNFELCLGGGALRRQVAHEVHHCLRMAERGHPRTLGDALVSEGLAGHFVGHVCGSGPELWECGVSDKALRAHAPSAEMLSASHYDHGAWFFGQGGKYPRWLGYTLGYRIVGDWLATKPQLDGLVWANVATDVVLAPWKMSRP